MKDFELIPAIDLYEGQVVRLRQGRYDAVTVYADDAAAMAARFAQQGAKRLHVVDLEGARDGRPIQQDAVRRILDAGALEVQVGGGVRSPELARNWLETGAARVVIGTLAVKAPEETQALCAAFPGRIVVALDARNGEVATEGWLKTSGRALSEVAAEVDSWTPAALLCTAIERDGTQQGPDLAGLEALQAQVKTQVIASGGVHSFSDIPALYARGLRAAVTGRAVYEGALDLGEAFRQLGQS